MSENERREGIPEDSQIQNEADQIVAAMEQNPATDSHATPAELEAQVLSDAIRESAGVDLPESSAELREMVSAAAEDSMSAVAPVKPVKQPMPTSRPAWQLWGAIAASLLIVGSLVYVSLPSSQFFAFGVDLRGGANSVGELDMSALEDPVEAKPDYKYQEMQEPSIEQTGQAGGSAQPGMVRGEDLSTVKSDSGQRGPDRSPVLESKDLALQPNRSMGDREEVSPSEKDESAPVVGNLAADNSKKRSDRKGMDAYSKTKSTQSQLNSELSLFEGAVGGQSLGRELERSGKGFANADGLDRFAGGKGGGGFGGGGRFQNGQSDFGRESLGEQPRGYYEDSRGRGFRQRAWNGSQKMEFESREQYDPIYENAFKPTKGMSAVSTFSTDVDTASYANIRRFLERGQRVPPNAVRIEEMVNYFNYDYPQPEGDAPFSVNMEMATCPWNTRHKLLRVGLQGKDVHRDERPQANIVFLIDVSGSMRGNDKLPLLKSGFRLMVNALNENDSVSIVTYAGSSKIVLEPTSGDQKQKILSAIDNLKSGGSTNGSAGIENAYRLAQQNFIKEGSNKVILATDGDLNVGVTSDEALVDLIKEKASEGVFLTVLGFGTGNLKDSKMEKLADNGNGVYAYIDGVREAHKVLVEGMSGSLVTIAKDVKIQIEFNPGEVKAYRLIGYENRILAAKDFDDDTKDAGEIGAGHTVTALYELITVDSPAAMAEMPQGLKYQQPKEDVDVERDNDKDNEAGLSNELLTLALRFKQPDSDESDRIEFTLENEEKSFSTASSDFRFAASVAGFGMILRGSEHRGNVTPQWVQEVASAALGEDSSGYRSEFIDLVRRFSSAR